MRLEADAIEGHILGLERLHQAQQRRCLRARILDVVLVDVQLRVRIRCACGVERDLDVGRAEGVVEDVRAPSAVVVERFIDDVPAINLALVMTDKGAAVVLDDGGQVCGGEATA